MRNIIEYYRIKKEYSKVSLYIDNIDYFHGK